MKIFKDIAPLLESKWRECQASNDTIVGLWAEDRTAYELRVPYQLRELIIRMQNFLHAIFWNLQHKKNEYSRAVSDLEALERLSEEA